MGELTFILQIIANGLNIGFIYVLLALGFSLIFGVMGIFNFSHGQLYMLGAYATYYLFAEARLPYPLAVILTMLLVGSFGALLERVFFRPVYGKLFPSFMIALGLNMIIGTSALLAFGEKDHSVPTVISGVMNLGGVRLTWQVVLATLISALSVTLLFLLVHHTKIGMCIRAIALNRDAAYLQGVNVERLFIQTFAISAGLAGVAGAIIAPIYFINPLMGDSAMQKCIVVVILGGLGSIPGAIAGGLTLGFIESIGLTFIGNSAHIIGWVFVILLLLFKPQGILGRE